MKTEDMRCVTIMITSQQAFQLKINNIHNILFVGEPWGAVSLGPGRVFPSCISVNNIEVFSLGPFYCF